MNHNPARQFQNLLRELDAMDRGAPKSESIRTRRSEILQENPQIFAAAAPANLDDILRN